MIPNFLAIRREEAWSITGLVMSDRLTNQEKALYCLCEAETLAQEGAGMDGMAPLWLAAAQTFALLAQESPGWAER